MTIYLYKKTHNITGLKYLGKTTAKDPHKYEGSGKYWKSHIKKHGYDVTTEILKECASLKEVAYWGKYYSELWNVVEDRTEAGEKTWANLMPESGDGGDSGWRGNKGVPLSEEHKEKMRGPRGPISPETRAKRIGKKRGPSPLKGKFSHTEDSIIKMRKPKPEGHSEKLRNVAKNRPRSPCPFCGKMYQAPHMPRHLTSHDITTP